MQRMMEKDFVAGFLHDQDKKRVDFINFLMNENP